MIENPQSQLKDSIFNIQLAQQKTNPSTLQNIINFKKSFPQLKFLLQRKNTNLIYNKSEIQKANCKNFLLGIDIAKIQNNVKAYRENKKNIGSFNNNSISKIDKKIKIAKQENIGQFIQQNIQNGIIQDIGNQIQNLRINQQAYKIMSQKIKKQKPNLIKQDSAISKSNRYKPQVYKQIIFKRQDSSFSALSLINDFRSKTDNQFWHILYYQLKNINIKINSNDKQLVKKLTLKIFFQSCHYLQKKFLENTQNHLAALNLIVINQYLKKIKNPNRIFKDKHNRYVWGIVYILFRAGKQKQILTFLKQDQQIQLDIKQKFISDFNKYKIYIQQQQLQYNRQEKLLVICPDSSDIFLNHLYEIFNESESLQQYKLFLNNDQNILWFFLKTLNYEAMKEHRQILIKKINKDYQEDSLICLLLSVGYQQLINDVIINNCEMYCQQVRIHFIKIMYDTKFINIGFFSQHALQRIQIIFIDYLQKQLNISQDLVLKYLCFVPSLIKPQKLKKFLINNNLLQYFLGFKKLNTYSLTKYRQNLNNQQIYKYIIQTIAEDISSTDHQLSAKIYLKILKNENAAIQCLLTKIICCIIRQQFNDIQNILQKIEDTFPKLPIKYAIICQFIQFYCKIHSSLKSIQEGNFGELKSLNKLINSNEFCEISQEISQTNEKVIKFLINKQLFEVYKNFIKIILKILQYCISRINIQKKVLSEKLRDILDFCNVVKQQYQDQDNRIGIKTIVQVNKIKDAVDQIQDLLF